MEMYTMWQLLLLVAVINSGQVTGLTTEERDGGLFTKQHFCVAAGEHHLDYSPSYLSYACKYIDVTNR